MVYYDILLPHKLVSSHTLGFRGIFAIDLYCGNQSRTMRDLTKFPLFMGRQV